MPRNLGATSLKRKRRAGNPMSDYDRLPSALRNWMAEAVLPWRARSVQVAYEKALARKGNEDMALKELDRLQDALIAKDALRVWGRAHPQAEARSLET